MVFSFFKKPPEKMVAKPSVVPKSKDSAAEAVNRATNESVSATAAEPSPGLVAASVPPAVSELSDFVFSESSPDFQIEAEIDPVDACAEEAAMLYANRQDAAVRAVLENSVQIHAFGPGERLWLMLFDLYRLDGNKKAFESLEIEYARCFEKSPPGWFDKSDAPEATVAVAGSVLFRGELIGENAAAFESIRQALEKNPRLRLDVTKVRQFDADGCGKLLSLMLQARKSKREIELLGRDALGVMLQSHVVAGVAQDRECWLLFLELCQLQGQHEIFEDVAVDYAVTFEVSPPSWEAGRVASPDLADAVASNPTSSELDAYPLQGDIRALRFNDLSHHAESRDVVVIDCSRLIRMDFISAGALLNVLTAIRRSGKPIIFHHPNHLVAELFGVVGLKAVATLVFAKY